MVLRLRTTVSAVAGVKIGATALGAASLAVLGISLADSPHNSGKHLPARAALNSPAPPQIALAPPLNLPPPALPSPAPITHAARPHVTTHHTTAPKPSAASSSPAAAVAAADLLQPSPTPSPTQVPGRWHGFVPQPSPAPTVSATPSPTCGPGGCDNHRRHHGGPTQPPPPPQPKPGGPGGPGQHGPGWWLGP